jgi:hypothetical protein
LHVRKLCTKSGTIKQATASAYRVYHVSIDNILMLRYEEQCKGDCLRFIICAYYLWDMASNVSLFVPFDNMKNWKSVQVTEKKVNSTKGHITDDEASRQILNWCYPRSLMLTADKSLAL